MKKFVWLAVLAALIFKLGSAVTAQAEIIPPYGEGQFGLEAVVLCENLTVREGKSAASKAVETLPYGRRMAIMEESDGWALCILSDDVDASPAGWVDSDYLCIDPAWYRTEKKTTVYAWNDAEAPKVALLAKNTTLPILKEDGEWVLVSLRGAVGWIKKTASD